ncbi:MAG: hypothetical protein QW112_00380 [Candidatus Micrarchaeia archaeon]
MTLEAFMSLLVVLILLLSLPLLLGWKEGAELGSFVLLADSFDVLEGGYHDAFARWLDNDPINPGFSDFSNYFEFLRNTTEEKYSSVIEEEFFQSIIVLQK